MIVDEHEGCVLIGRQVLKLDYGDGCTTLCKYAKNHSIYTPFLLPYKILVFIPENSQTC